MEILAIIPARGGSKGIPKKNLQPLAGKPMVAYSIEAAKQAPSVTRVVVSTDDPEIAEISKGFGADIVLRPAAISGDSATSEAALRHAVRHLQAVESYYPDLIVFLQCTSPLTLPEDIEGTVQTLLQENADSALSVSPFHYFLWAYDAKGEVQAVNHDKYVRPRRQDRDPQYVETGAVYVMRREGFLQANHRFFGKIAMYKMPLERRLEVDDPIDLKIADLLIKEGQDFH